MIDIKLIYRFPEIIKKRLISKGFKLDTDKLLLLDKERKLIQNKLDKLKQEKNICNNKIKTDLTYKLQECKEKILLLNKNINLFQIKLNQIKEEIHQYFITIPNIPDEDVPLGKNYNDNKEIYQWGEKRNFNFKVRDHVSIAKNFNNGIDIFTASAVAKSKFVILQGQIAYLYRALNQFMLDVHTNRHGYLETYVPYLCNKQSLYFSGQLPKFEDDLFYVTNNIGANSLALIPTSEVPLINLFQGKTLVPEDLPFKLVSSTPCFRLEAGSYGKINKGLMRLHQFDKVELVQITSSDHSSQSLEDITLHAEQILRLLNLPYRKLLLCTGDMTFGSAKTYDLEVWLPASKSYLEVSSCSNMKDFQARRMKTKIKNITNHNILPFVHTLNGSGLAIGRTLIAVLENYQTDNPKCIEIPMVLQNYFKQQKYIYA